MFEGSYAPQSRLPGTNTTTTEPLIFPPDIYRRKLPATLSLKVNKSNRRVFGAPKIRYILLGAACETHHPLNNRLLVRVYTCDRYNTRSSLARNRSRSNPGYLVNHPGEALRRMSLRVPHERAGRGGH